MSNIYGQVTPGTWSLWPRSWPRQIALLAAFAIGLTVTVNLLYTISEQISHQQISLERKSAAIASQLANAVVSPLVTSNYADGQDLLTLAGDYPGMVSIHLIDNKQRVFSSFERPGVAPTTAAANAKVDVPTTRTTQVQWHYGASNASNPFMLGLDATQFSIWQPIQNGLGWLHLVFSAEELRAQAKHTIENTLVLAVISVVAGAMLFFMYLRRSSAALQKATEFAGVLSISRGNLMQVNRGSAELEALGEALNEASLTLHSQESALVGARIAAEAANRAKSEFLANMSHEIRTPLTAIIGFTRSLNDNALPAEERERAVSSIGGAGGRLLGIVNNIIDYSEIESGQFTLAAKALSPYVIIEEIARTAQERARQKNVGLSVKYEMPLPAQITTDPTRFRQILDNLCLNATTFTERGEIVLRVRGDKAEGYLTVDVEDTGIGMTADDIDRIFLPFTQADTSSSRQYGGVGLGLAIAQKLTQRLNGQIKCKSALGVGSTFSLCLPVGPAETLRWVDKEVELDKGAKPDGDGAKRVLKGRILLAEDTLLNQKLIKFTLSKLGLDCVIVENGQLAVEYALSHELDLILMDIQMPIMDGVTATIQLKQAGFVKPIIAVTANVMADDRAKYLSAGIIEVVAKPIDPVTMYGVLSKYLPHDASKGSNLVAPPS